MSGNANLGTEAVRAMVEDHWRSFLAVTRQHPEMAQASILQFDDRMQATASSMPPEQAQAFLQAVDDEGSILADEYDRDPDALRCRLGLSLNTVLPHAAYHRSSLSDMAVGIPARATIGRSLVLLFRRFS